MARKRVTITLSDDEHALCERAAEPQYVSDWMRALALTEARSQLEPIDQAGLERMEAQDLPTTLATLREKAAGHEGLVNAVVSLERALAKVMAHLKRQDELLSAAALAIDRGARPPVG